LQEVAEDRPSSFKRVVQLISTDVRARTMPARPFHVVAPDQPWLHQLRDGRFQIVRSGKLSAILTGYHYVLVTEDVLTILRGEHAALVPGSAVVFDPATKQDIADYSQLQVMERLTPETLDAVDPAAQIWLHAQRDLFVSPNVYQKLADRFPDLRFSEGFSGFAGQSEAARHRTKR
jgi:hypothetical protein